VSRKFKKYKISDLNSVEVVLVPNESLIHDLKLISQIDRTALFNSVEDLDYNQQLEVLKKYIAESKKIMLSDLFDIRFLINNKSVNMSKQTESNGTDRILKITLFLVIMQDLFVQDDANKLVIYVDELGEVDDDNIQGFITRCKENNFIPIFAGPDKKPNISKYYDLLALKNKQIVVDESRAIYVKNRI
jgi:ribosomal protein S18